MTSIPLSHWLASQAETADTIQRWFPDATLRIADGVVTIRTTRPRADAVTRLEQLQRALPGVRLALELVPEVY